MKTGRALALFICAVMAFCLCGCDTFTVDTEKLISPPELTGSMYPIGKALSESVRGEYQLKYPQFGEYRSAIILKDIDGDKTPEAFAFYSTAGDEMTNMHINAIRQNGDEYKSVSEQTVVAGGVERVEFCDLDGDGISEIIVGWEVYGVSEKQLCVYSLNRDNMAVMLSEKYTGFLNCDLTGNGREELFVNVLDTANFSNTAELYGFSGGAAQKLGSCALDPAVKTALTPTLSKLTTGQDAVFIDEIKGAGAVTEVVYFAGGELKNPLYEEENNEGSRTLRAAAILSSDIDSDLALEIPVAKELPNAAGTDEQLFYTDWCGFDGVNLIVKRITIVNSIDGYYLEIPQNLVGKIAVLKDIDNHRRVIYGYDAETGEISERLATVAVIYAGDWDSDDYDRSGMFELARRGDAVFAGAVNPAAAGALTEEALAEMFKLTQ